MLHFEGNGQLKYKNGSKIEQRCVIEGNSPNFFISMKVASTFVLSYDPIFSFTPFISSLRSSTTNNLNKTTNSIIKLLQLEMLKKRLLLQML